MDIYQAADLYDLQYLHYRDDIPHYLRLAADYGGPILELGAGTGRLTEALAGAGHYVTGIELSPEMLELGRRRLEAAGLTERAQLREGDMRDLDLGRRYPLVIAGFNTLMHLHSLGDQDRALASVREHLEPGGLFAFDLYAPHFGAMGVVRSEPEWRHVGGEDGELFLVQEHDELNQTVTSRYFLDSTSADGTLRRRTATLRQRYYTRFEIERALQANGFTNIAIAGGFDGSPLTGGSRHFVVRAKTQRGS